MLNHHNIVKLEEVLEDEHHIYLIMELCGGGSLADYVAIKVCSILSLIFFNLQTYNHLVVCIYSAVISKFVSILFRTFG